MQGHLLVILAFGFGLSVCHAGEADVPARIHADVVASMQKARVPGLAIAKIENGRVAWSGAFGERAPNQPLDKSTVFNVASLTKPVFATATLSLTGTGTLALDEPVSAYWVDPDVADDPRHEQLTPRILLSHQSGFPNWRGSNTLDFMFTPGERHEYSGEGYEYLRRALEKNTGKSLNALLAGHVFEPAGMHHSTAGWSDGIGDNVAKGFNEAGEPIDTHLTERGPNAAANLMTTIGDYARFTAWVARGAGLPAEVYAEMTRPQALHSDPAELFSLGWKLIPFGKQTALMHDGREPGVRSYAIVLPDSDAALVIFTNSSNGELVFRPLVKAALPEGEAIVRSTDQLVWRYLKHLPPQALVPMSRGIARSPSFMSTLLHAVDTVLIQDSGLSDEEKTAASRAVDPYVFALMNGRIETAEAEALVSRLLEKHGDSLNLRKDIDDAQAREWLNALQR